MASVPVIREPTGSASEWRAIESEHMALGAFAERLRERLRTVAIDAPTEAALLELKRGLEEFRGRLVAHLGSEERSGVLERAAAAEPRFHRRWQRLQREHRDLRQGMDAVVSLVAKLAWVEVRSRFEALSDALRAHERDENEMLQRVYLEDIGGRG